MKDWNETFEDAGAIWRMPADNSGSAHVVTRLSGLHVASYFNSDMIVSRSNLLDEVVEDVLVPQIEDRGILPDWVLTYAPYGVLVAGACARILGTQVAYTNPAANTQLSRVPEEGDEVLVVCDDLHGGGSVREVVSQAQFYGANPAPIVFTLANMSGSRVLDGFDVVSAVEIEKGEYPKDDCPMCKAGSYALDARENWAELIGE